MAAALCVAPVAPCPMNTPPSETYNELAISAAHSSQSAIRETLNINDSVASFDRDEIQVGQLLGMGSFAEVYEVKAISLLNKTNQFPDHQLEKRNAIAGSPADAKKLNQYAIKHLKSKVVNEDDFLCAAEDIVQEAEILSSLSHPNIIKVHGVPSLGPEAFLQGSNGYFLIIDKLEDTLDKRLHHWSSQETQRNTRSSLRKMSFFKGGVDTKAKSQPTIFSETLAQRIKIACDIALALNYLHQNHIIYRDLKPGNIGFDIDGNVKLFDFGFARVLSPLHNTFNDVFEMSGAGSPRYCSPEVLLLEPYNLKADIYSFAVVLSEILSLESPFSQYENSKQEFIDAVTLRGERPVVNPLWPRSIRDGLNRAFSKDITMRPTMEFFIQSLQEWESSLKDKKPRAQVFRSNSLNLFDNRVRRRRSKIPGLDMVTKNYQRRGKVQHNRFSRQTSI